MFDCLTVPFFYEIWCDLSLMFTFVHWGDIREGSNLVTDGVRNHHDAAVCLDWEHWLVTGQTLCQPRPGQQGQNRRKVRITQISDQGNTNPDKNIYNVMNCPRNISKAFVKLNLWKGLCCFLFFRFHLRNVHLHQQKQKPIFIIYLNVKKLDIF